eukprot:12882486-Alexandrium_andersonii.AAC.1
MLDLVCAAAGVQDDVICRWPAQAPGYLQHLPKLFPGTPPKDRWQCRSTSAIACSFECSGALSP